MTIKDQIRQDITAAMKAGDTVTRDALRLVFAAIEKKEKPGTGAPVALKDPEIISLLNKEVATREGTKEIYIKANKADRAAKEQKEIDIISRYLPTPLTQKEVERIIADVITELGASTMKDMGKVMKGAGERIAGRFDNKKVSEIVRSQLS